MTHFEFIQFLKKIRIEIDCFRSHWVCDSILKCENASVSVILIAIAVKIYAPMIKLVNISALCAVLVPLLTKKQVDCDWSTTYQNIWICFNKVEHFIPFQEKRYFSSLFCILFFSFIYRKLPKFWLVNKIVFYENFDIRE